MPSKNTTHLAGEFLVAGELSRRGYPVSITFEMQNQLIFMLILNQGQLLLMLKQGAQNPISPLKKKT